MDVGPPRPGHFGLRALVKVPEARGARVLRTPTPMRCGAQSWPGARNSTGCGWVIISPAGFEGFFEEVDVLARRGPPDMGQVVALAVRYGVEILGPPHG